MRPNRSLSRSHLPEVVIEGGPFDFSWPMFEKSYFMIVFTCRMTGGAVGGGGGGRAVATRGAGARDVGAVLRRRYAQ